MSLSCYERLIAHSLKLWAVDSAVVQVEQESLSVTARDVRILIVPAEAGLPFRWTVTTNERRRTASSVTGLLRQLRLELDVEYTPARLQFFAHAPDTTTLS